MTNQIRSELIKLRSVRSNVALLALCAAITMAGAVLTTYFSKSQQEIDDILIGLGLAGLLAMVLGVQVVGQEYRFNTIRVTLAQNPRRIRVLAAKAVALALTVTAGAVSMIFVAAGAAAVTGFLVDRPVDLAAAGSLWVAVGAVAQLLVLALFGLQIGAIVRQPVAGIMITLIWSFSELTFGNLLRDSVRWLPVQAGNNLATLDPNPAYLAAAPAALYQFSIIGALFVIAAARVRVADA